MNIPKYAIPLLVIAFLTGGYFLRSAFTQPTTSVNFSGAGEEKLQCTVEGLKCKGTANFFTSLYKETVGISSIETVASEHLVIFTYDASLITPEKIKSIMETPVPLRDGSHHQIFRCLDIEKLEP